MPLWPGEYNLLQRMSWIERRLEKGESPVTLEKSGVSWGVILCILLRKSNICLWSWLSTSLFFFSEKRVSICLCFCFLCLSGLWILCGTVKRLSFHQFQETRASLPSSPEVTIWVVCTVCSFLASIQLPLPSPCFPENGSWQACGTGRAWGKGVMYLFSVLSFYPLSLG